MANAFKLKSIIMLKDEIFVKYGNHLIDDDRYKIYGEFRGLEDLYHLQWGKGKCHQGICPEIDQYCDTKSSSSQAQGKDLCYHKPTNWTKGNLKNNGESH